MKNWIISSFILLASLIVIFINPLCAPALGLGLVVGGIVGLRGTRNATARIVSGVAITAGIVILLGIILVWVLFFQTSSGGGIISR